jgi:prepilin peptidase CpaA
LPLPSDVVTTVVLACGAGVAAGVDLATRRIPNGVTVPLAVLGLALAAGRVTAPTLGSAVMGCGLGLLAMLPGYWLGATGAGDVKLFAALGTLLGVERVPAAFVGTALAGGVLALALAVARGRLGKTLLGTVGLVAAPARARRAIEAAQAGSRFPYGPAVAVGCLLAAW